MTTQPEPEDLTGAWTPDPLIGCMLPGAAAEPRVAADNCDHHYATDILGGHPLHVRACTLCHKPDWGDLMEQAAELYRWGWGEGAAGKPAREALSAYDKPPETADGPVDRPDAHDGPQAAQGGPLRDLIAEALAGHAGSKAFLADGTEWDHARDAWYGHADAVLDAILPTTRLLGALHRAAHEDITRVIDLYERWVKAGPPPIGTPMARWWDTRLVELHDAILPPGHDDGPTVREAAADDRKWPLEREGE